MNVWGSNMFDSIWKAQIQKPKGGATIFQPKEKMKPDKPDDRDCCKEAAEAWNQLWDDDMTWEDEVCELMRSLLTNHDKLQSSVIGHTSNWARRILDQWEECERNVQ